MKFKAMLAKNPLSKYLREAYQEMKKVTWPTRNVVVKHSIVVVGISIAVAAFFGILDVIFASGIERIIEIF